MTYLIATPSQLGLALKSARKTLGLTQTEAAARVGLLPKTISALENHAESCSIESLLRLLSVLGLELTLTSKARSTSTPDQKGW
ncbi:MAG: helix-turn-helix domain-containing protein [Spirochaetaceae bacterium]|nr:helix-turn-helix domain-containing protein [Spirochaetaceae bacterium]